MYSEERKKAALKLYQKTGSLSETVNMLGYPTVSALRQWAMAAGVHEKKFEHGRRRRYNQETKEKALHLAYEVGMPLKQVAKSLGITSSTTISYWHRLEQAGKLDAVRGDDIAPTPVDGEAPLYPDDPEQLKDMLRKMQLENDILRGTVDVLKACGLSGYRMSNKEKTALVDSLRPAHLLKDVIPFLKISKSSYEYQHKATKQGDRYAWLRPLVREEFERCEGVRGYRTICALLRKRQDPVVVSEKVVRKIMREEGLVVSYAGKRRRRYSSYRGEISLAPPNVVKRNFHAEAPNQLWLTDITEFKVNDKKCYLSPIIDCYDGMVVSWRVSSSPSADMVNHMLEEAIATLEPGEHPIIHSDRGVHYRWPEWITLCEENGLQRSMSAKGCTPDNSACEGFFGRLKNEFYYYRDWKGVTIEEFSKRLNKYIRNYNEKRVKQSLGWLSPVQYRQAQACAASA